MSTASAVRTRPNRAGDDRRERAIAAAVDHFTRLGYRGASVAAIARDAGLTDAGLLHHFGSKSGLFLAVVERREDDLRSAFDHEPASLADFAEMLVEAERRSLEHPELVRFQATLAGELALAGHPFHDLHVDKQRVALEQMTAVLARFSDELAPGVEPIQLARELIALHHGLRAEWLILPDGMDLAATFAAAVRRSVGRAVRTAG
ncbi:TetR family transcriptional regulator [Agromyces seonyuensis]|uniref:TetR family transcriptional regulator n=1 Tax=Agromyces seonyuensis TaxID=2662446 RepID=A0A6I4NSC7_9MICO|nr:TetR family transcriptional regulator [Agromyces seonyuensis]